MYPRRVREDEVIARIAALVAAGEYRDVLYGRPSVALDGAAVLHRGNGETGFRRVFQRGTPEHAAAKAAGLVERLPALLAATPEAVQEAEALVGTHLPLLLRRLYLEVGNGGFGPGYGLLGLAGGHDDQGRTAVDLYRAREFPAHLLPLLTWGCAIYSLVDLRDGAVWGYDPNPGEPPDGLFPEWPDLAGWFDRWLCGDLHQPFAVRDDASGRWRNARDDEWAAVVSA